MDGFWVYVLASTKEHVMRIESTISIDAVSCASKQRAIRGILTHGGVVAKANSRVCAAVLERSLPLLSVTLPEKASVVFGDMVRDRLKISRLSKALRASDVRIDHRTARLNTRTTREHEI